MSRCGTFSVLIFVIVVVVGASAESEEDSSFTRSAVTLSVGGKIVALGLTQNAARLNMSINEFSKIPVVVIRCTCATPSSDGNSWRVGYQVCSSAAQRLSRKRLAVYVRAAHHWERYIPFRLWRDAGDATAAGTPHDSEAPSQGAEEIVTFNDPAALNAPDDPAVDAFEMPEFTEPRKEITKSCSDITDECFSTKYFTYTSSFKYIGNVEETDQRQYPHNKFAHRMAARIDDAQIGFWSLRIENNLPHDASTVVEVIVVLEDHVLPFFLISIGGIVVYFAFTALCAMALTILQLHNERLRATARERHETEGTADVDIEGQPRGQTQPQPATWWATTQMRVSRYFARVRRSHVASGDTAAVEMGNHALANESTTSFESVASPGGVEPTPCRREDATEDSEDVCRICRCASPKASLFSPCRCSGTSKYVHRECLQKWRDITTNPEHQRICAECKTPYCFVSRSILMKEQIIRSFFALCRFMRVVITTCALVIVGGYALKAWFFVVTLFRDQGIHWSCASWYHCFLGALLILAANLYYRATYQFLELFSRRTQILFVLTAVAVSTPVFGYFGAFIIYCVSHTVWTWEVQFGTGIIVAWFSFQQMIQPCVVWMQQHTLIIEEVADRAEVAAHA